jgi:hypothetical protein
MAKQKHEKEKLNGGSTNAIVIITMLVVHFTYIVSAIIAIRNNSAAHVDFFDNLIGTIGSFEPPPVVQEYRRVFDINIIMNNAQTELGHVKELDTRTQELEKHAIDAEQVEQYKSAFSRMKKLRNGYKYLESHYISMFQHLSAQDLSDILDILLLGKPPLERESLASKSSSLSLIAKVMKNCIFNAYQLRLLLIHRPSLGIFFMTVLFNTIIYHPLMNITGFALLRYKPPTFMSPFMFVMVLAMAIAGSPRDEGPKIMNTINPLLEEIVNPKRSFAQKTLGSVFSSTETNYILRVLKVFFERFVEISTKSRNFKGGDLNSLFALFSALGNVSGYLRNSNFSQSLSDATYVMQIKQQFGDLLRATISHVRSLIAIVIVTREYSSRESFVKMHADFMSNTADPKEAVCKFGENLQSKEAEPNEILRSAYELFVPYFSSGCYEPACRRKLCEAYGPTPVKRLEDMANMILFGEEANPTTERMNLYNRVMAFKHLHDMCPNANICGEQQQQYAATPADVQIDFPNNDENRLDSNTPNPQFPAIIVTGGSSKSPSKAQLIILAKLLRVNIPSSAKSKESINKIIKKWIATEMLKIKKKKVHKK